MDPLAKDYLSVNDFKKADRALYDTMEEIVEQSVFYHSYEDNHLFYKKVHANIKCELTETQMKTAIFFMYTKLRETSSSFGVEYCLYILEHMIKSRIATIKVNSKSGEPYGSRMGNFFKGVLNGRSNLNISIWEKCDRDDANSMYKRYEEIYEQLKAR